MASPPQWPGKPATILDVAELAQVSFKTVSRVINREGKVRDSTRKRVLEAVAELGYRPNPHARSLRAKGSRIIGLLVSNPSRNYLSELQWGAVQACQRAGLTLATEDFAGVSTSVLLRGGADGAAGVILTPPLCENAELVTELERLSIPVCLIAPGEDHRRADSVVIDDRAAAREMTAHLIAQGHTRIGFIQPPDTFAQPLERERGFRDAIGDAGVDVCEPCIAPGQFTFESGRRAAVQLLSLDKPPTAIFASNDDMAAGVLAEGYRRNLRVPNDLAVAGFDDTPLAALISPALTSVGQPVGDMAARAVEMLAERTVQPDLPLRIVTLPHTLHIRSTTGCSPSN